MSDAAVPPSFCMAFITASLDAKAEKYRNKAFRTGSKSSIGRFISGGAIQVGIIVRSDSSTPIACLLETYKYSVVRYLFPYYIK